MDKQIKQSNKQIKQQLKQSNKWIEKQAVRYIDKETVQDIK